MYRNTGVGSTFVAIRSASTAGISCSSSKGREELVLLVVAVLLVIAVEIELTQASMLMLAVNHKKTLFQNSTKL